MVNIWGKLRDRPRRFLWANWYSDASLILIAGNAQGNRAKHERVEFITKSQRVQLSAHKERLETMPEQKDLYRAHLVMALFCEKMLREADGVLSIIRVIDRFTVRGTTPEMQPTVLNFTILVSFKSGLLRGKQVIALLPKSPSGDDMPAMQFPVLFEGDNDRGNVLAAQVNFIVDREGLYWFDLHLNEELITRMPLRVEYQQTALPTAG